MTMVLPACVMVLAYSCLMSSSHAEKGEVYFNAPFDSGTCPEDQVCKTITHYNNFTSNTIYYLMPGIHVLEESSMIYINSLENVTFQGIGAGLLETDHLTVNQANTTTVMCSSNSSTGFVFYKSENIAIRNLTIVNCGGNLTNDLVNSIEEMMFSTADDVRIYERWMRFKMAIFFMESKGILLEYISVLNSSNYGLVAVNPYDLTINYSSIAFSNLENREMTCSECFGGNAFLFYALPDECDWTFKQYKTIISHSKFSHGFDSSTTLRYSGSGLAIYLTQNDAFGVHHVIDNVVFHSNNGFRGANFRYSVIKGVVEHALYISEVKSVYANQQFVIPEEPSVYGAGIYINIGRVPRRTKSLFQGCFDGNYTSIEHRVTILINHTESSHNVGMFGTGLYLVSDDVVENQYSSIYNCTFDNNTGFAGAGILLVQENNLNYEIKLKDIAVVNSNPFHLSTGSSGIIASGIMVRRLTVEFMNLRVENNPFTGVFQLSTQAHYIGEILFINNTALYGGGLQLHGDSCMILEAPVTVTFQSNTALRTGGAIFIEPTPFILIPCFFQPFQPNDPLTDTIKVTMFDNFAYMGGDSIYGAGLSSCELTMISQFYNEATDRKRQARRGDAAFDAIFTIQEMDGLSVITSDPHYVCFCNNSVPVCSNRTWSTSLYPGDETSIDMVAVGERHGTAPGIINMEVLYGTSIIDQGVLSSGANCTTVNYTALVQENLKVNINYFINQASSSNNLSIEVEILNCSLGFELAKEKCDCSSHIRDLPKNVTCDQSSASFWHKGGVWIGYDNNSDCIVTSSTCQLNYCTDKEVTFTLNTQDKQCRFDRSGVACGQCREGFSLILGGNECRRCNDNYLALLVVFAFAGILLVLFLLLLNFTVSFGTINGLIFYANIVKINEAYIFPERTIAVEIFFSWVNLDFGIPTCFTSNLNSIQKASLQLVFPFYLWLVVLFITIAIHYSTKLTKLMGRKIIPVIATLLLLSFTKLLRACVLAWNSDSYECNGEEVRVWTFDPNKEYWKSEHAMLQGFTITIFIFLIVPYTLSLALSPLMERYFSRFKLFSWWIKLKPFIDAYDGPYRDKYRYWTGMLLLIRVMLVPVFAIDMTLGRNLTVVLAVLLLSHMAFISGLYRHKALDALEIWFIFQLFLVIQTASMWVRSFSIFASMLTFFGILVFHILYQLNLVDKIKDFAKKKWENRREVRRSIHRTLTTYTRDLLSSTQRPGTKSSVRVSDNAKYFEEGSWVVNKRETLLRDYSESTSL